MIESATNQAVCGILPNKKYLPEFLYCFLKSKRDYFVPVSAGGAQPNISQTIIRDLMLPLPPIKTQREIVASFKEKISIVDQNKRLIEIFRQKINNRIADVWGK